MSMPEKGKSLVYLILGAAGSGRREVLADLIEGDSGGGGTSAVLLEEGEAADEADGRLGRVGRWRWSAGGTIAAELPDGGADRVFFVTNGRLNPVDQVEAFKAWLPLQDAELGRIICVVDCGLAERSPALLAWYDACIHFSDVVLLNRREGVANKWVRDFQERYKGQFFPCVMELVRAGRVRNPALILNPSALRISQVFEDEPAWIPLGGDPEDEAGEGEAEGDEEVEMVLAEDPYFARRPGGRRAREIPDIAKFLDAKREAKARAGSGA
ncbi:MAG: hypothetical protein ABSA05_10365 [Opitutaceae bacterium]|jgi:hypothetical protein